MISTEIALVIVFTLLGTAIFLMYRYFSELINEMTRCIDYHEENGRFGLKCEKEALNNRIDLLEQKFKDDIQSNAICCKSAIEKLKGDFGYDDLLKVYTRMDDLEINKSDKKYCEILLDKSKMMMNKIDTRLIRVETTLYSSENKNENNQRVISVIVPNIEDVPMAVQLGNSGNRPQPAQFNVNEIDKTEIKKTKKDEGSISVVIPDVKNKSNKQDDQNGK